LDLANTLREEKRLRSETAQLQDLDKNFYEQVGTYLSDLERELSKIQDQYGLEAEIIKASLKSDRNRINELIDLRIQKIVRRAVKNAFSASREDSFQGMTHEEKQIYGEILAALVQGRETILAHIAHTERTLTGKKEIPQEYKVVRLLDSVPMFIGVDGYHYRLSKDDVVVLPAVHARNLCNKNLAYEVKIER
jgi:DNA replication factor GINS